MCKERKSKVSEIKVWYKFKPDIKIWLSGMNGKTRCFKIPEETWYDGYWFNSGWFAFIQLKRFSVHILIKWWRIKV